MKHLKTLVVVTFRHLYMIHISIKDTYLKVYTNMYRIREAHEFVSRDFVNLFYCILLDTLFKGFQTPFYY